MNIMSVRLSGGAFQLIPDTIGLINPECESRKAYLYFVWAYYLDDRASLDEAIRGTRGIAAYGLLTDWLHLYAVGREDPSLPQSLLDAMLPVYEMLEQTLIGRMRLLVEQGRAWAFSFCLCDMCGNEVPVGTSCGYEFVARDDGGLRGQSK